MNIPRMPAVVVPQDGPYPIFQAPMKTVKSVLREPWLRTGDSLKINSQHPILTPLASSSRIMGSNELRRSVSEKVRGTHCGATFESPNGTMAKNCIGRKVTRRPKLELCRTQSQGQRTQLSINADGSRDKRSFIPPQSCYGSGSSASQYEHPQGQSAQCSPPTSSQESSSTLLENTRLLEEMALRFDHAEEPAEQTQDGIQDGQINRLERAAGPPTKEGPERKVEYVVSTRSSGKCLRAHFGDVRAKELDEGPEKQSLYGRVVGRVGRWCSQLRKGKNGQNGRSKE